MNCGLCVDACPQKVIDFAGDHIEIDWDSCTACGACFEVCPTEAITISGKEMTVQEIVDRVEKERNYLIPGGGVTFSGGEPFLQSGFLREAAGKLKEKGYHVAVETCGYVDIEKMRGCLDHIDLLLYDLKTFDPELHQKTTGFDNEMIKQNLETLYPLVDVIVRIPIIPGVNDNVSELDRMAEYIAGVDKGARVDLLPYHSLGKSKYKSIGMPYLMEEEVVPDEADLQRFQAVFTKRGLRCEIV